MLQPVYEAYSLIESRFSVDPTIVSALADRQLMSAAEGLALTAPYGAQASGFEAGQLASYDASPANETTVIVSDNTTVVRGIFADSLVNTLRTYGVQQINATDTCKVSLYHSQGSFITDQFDAGIAAVTPSTLLFASAAGVVDNAAWANTSFVESHPVAYVDIAPNFSSDGNLHFTLI